jgi:hypothetical protein
MRDFFRQMPNRLLALYFEGRGGLAGLDFAAIKERKASKFYARPNTARAVSFSRERKRILARKL